MIDWIAANHWRTEALFWALIGSAFLP